MFIRSIVLSSLFLGGLSASAGGHCDSPDGPVIPVVHASLESGDLTPALRWIKPEYEAEVVAAFDEAVAVRGNPAARALADKYFTETFVRLHRMGEGEPYTGIKPAGTGAGVAVMAADRAVETGSGAALLALVTEAAAHGVHERFAKVKALKAEADESVEAGRAYVDAYVEFVHYVSRLHALATSGSGAASGDETTTADGRASDSHEPKAGHAH